MKYNNVGVSSTTATWSTNSQWMVPGVAAASAEARKYRNDRSSSAPVQYVHRFYPFVVEDRGRLGTAATTAIFIFSVLIATRTFPEDPNPELSRFLRSYSVPALRDFVADSRASFRLHVSHVKRNILQRLSAVVHGTLGSILATGIQAANAVRIDSTPPSSDFSESD